MPWNRHRKNRRPGATNCEHLERRQLLTSDLSLAINVDHSAPKYDQDVIVTIELENTGAEAATNTIVDVVLATGIVPLASNTSQFDPDTGAWTIDSLDSGQHTLLQLLVQLDQPGPQELTAEVRVSDQTDHDSTPGNGDETEDDYAATTLAITRRDLVAFGQAVTASGARFFGAEWSSTSFAQKEVFEDGQLHFPFINVANPDHSANQAATDAGITSIPVWRIGDTDFNQIFSIDEISALTGVAIPESDQPWIQPIADQIVEINSPLHVPIDAYDPNGGVLTATVSVGDTTVLDGTVLSGNRSLRIRTLNYGDMVFELFEARAPRPSSLIRDNALRQARTALGASR